MSPQVLFEVRGRLGVITLNRPEALNALNVDMVQQMLHQLTAWKDDEAVAQVLVRGSGDRGLCAGGDIRAIYQDILAARQRGDDDYATTEFLAAEFRLNLLIHDYPKPYVAFMDGVTLGGGIGISAHGSHRVVTERTKAGMPETTIGYLPDVGATYLLSRAPGQTGLHAGLTAQSFDAADTICLGLADVYLSSESLEELAAALEQSPVDEVLPSFAQTPPESLLQAQREWIDDAYAAPNLEQVLIRLQTLGATHEPAAAAREQILGKSPTALKLTLCGIQQARHSDLGQALQREYAAAQHQLAGHDFAEGIRALVIDKDKAPHWQPATCDEVPDALIASILTTEGHSALDLNSALDVVAQPQEAH